jgi:hypothetical protein
MKVKSMFHEIDWSNEDHMIGAVFEVLSSYAIAALSID